MSNISDHLIKEDTHLANYHMKMLIIRKMQTKSTVRC